MDTTTVRKEDALRQKLVTALGSLAGYYYPNPDDAPKPGPWDPINKTAISRFLGPFPEPWRIAAYRHPAIYDAIDPMSLVALNPQPLPPRELVVTEVARAAVERFALSQEIADMTNSAGIEQGIIVVGGRVSQFVDDFCGTVVYKKIPIPGPKGPEDEKFSGKELILAGMQFLNGTGSTASEALQREFQKAGEKLVDEGLRRI
jgi:hypothetical protein